MKIYTKGGDKGQTSLIGGERVAKNHPKVEAYGTVDELMAHIGYLHDMIDDNDLKDQLRDILRNLMDVSEVLATSKSLPYPKKEISEQATKQLELWIDQINDTLDPISDFTLPCGHPTLSFCHICRTICRRAERKISCLDLDDELVVYINRLSDYLYILGRKFTKQFNVKEILRNS